MHARRILLPNFILTLPTVDHNRVQKIDVCHSHQTSAGDSMDLAVRSVPRRGTRLYPMVLAGDGTPWPEANLWILFMHQESPTIRISTLWSIASDLSTYLRFLEERDIDWLQFPSSKLYRPTYRFSAFLKQSVQGRLLAPSTAKRAMATVVRLYRWLIDQDIFAPANAPWREGDRYISFTGSYGQTVSSRLVTTDVSIATPKQDDPYDGCIEDGGKLRPLEQQEQSWLLNALIALGNTEMKLIHIVALLTGARIQTILTLGVQDVMKIRLADPYGCARIPAGQGTGIDTKFNKRLVLHIPLWLCELLQAYATSDRAKQRRTKACNDATNFQYLFLSVRGAPLYTSSRDETWDNTSVLRHAKVGQAVRQYMTDYIIPWIRQNHASNFCYRFHDLRATYGLNFVDSRLDQIAAGELKLSEAMSALQTRMGHSSPSITERYFAYRSRIRLAREVQDGWEGHLKALVGSHGNDG